MEQADIEFVKLKSTIADYENSLSQSIKNNPSQIEINKASLTSFMSKNDNVINFENDVFIGEYNLVIEEFNIENYVDNRLINQIKNLGIENVEQLENAYLKNEKATREALKLIFKPEGRSMVRGGSVLVLINYVLSNEKG